MAVRLIGVDAGTTSIKVVAFSLNGEEDVRRTRETPITKPEQGWVEQDMTATWERTAEAVHEVVGALPDSADITAVGVTGQGDGCWLVDDDGAPVRNAILWSDGRAADYVRRWQKSGLTADIYDICGCAPFPGSSVPILNWLRDEEPGVIERADTAFFCKDWLKFRLTGERSTDFSDATLPYLDVEQTAYSDQIPNIVGVPELSNLRPPLVPAADIVGRITSVAADVTGLPEGTPVVSGLIDIAASALGSGAVDPGDSSSVVGTTSLNQTFVSSPRVDPPNVGFTIALGDGLWTRAMASMAGTPNLDWALSELLDTDDFDAIEGRVRSIPVGSEGVVYHPYLSSGGERSPFLKPTARAQFTGLSPDHTRDHLVRAVYEGVALAMRDCYEHIPGQTDAVLMGGGGARSDMWCQLFADCLGRRIDVPAGEEFGAKGAALLAGVGVGLYEDIESAVAQTTGVARTYHPTPDAAEKYDVLYDLYRETYEVMFDVWDRRESVLAEINGSTSDRRRRT